MLQFTKNKWLWAFLGLSILLVNPAWADKPEWAGNKRERQNEHKSEHKSEYRQDRRDDRRDDDDRDGRRHMQEKRGQHFSDHHRQVVGNHYGQYYRQKKKCPPGLMRKQNACVPPEHARRWEMHKPLPHDVSYYYVPSRVVAHMGPPPHGHRYVRVGTDILLIAIGTQMVVDAITDIAQ